MNDPIVIVSAARTAMGCLKLKIGATQRTKA